MGDLYKTPYLIVELANSHAGEIGELEKLVARFGEIDYTEKGIKFQIFSPTGIALPDFDWFSVYENLFFDKATWGGLIRKASKLGGVWIDIFDIYGTEILSENIKDITGIKIQASVLGNHEVRSALKKINLDDKRLIINISGIEICEAKRAFSEFTELCENIILQVGFQSYPTKIEDASLNKVLTIKAEFPSIPICMADHADGDSEFAKRVPAYASLLGCQYIEKHFCIDRKSAKYDGYSALDLAEINSVCESLKELSLAFGNQFINKSEKEYLEKTVQIPVLKNNMQIGTSISESDLVFRRTSQKGVDSRDIKNKRLERKVLSRYKKATETLNDEDFHIASVAIIVAGRMKSTRLPKKALLPIAGVSSVERCLSQCRAVSGIDKVILATSDFEEDAILEKHTLGGEVYFWKGHAEDVIQRYISACDEFGIDVVVRVTADCPLVLPEIIEYLIDRHFESGADYTAAKDFAVGSSGEVINTSALRKVASHFGFAKHSEYMTWYFRNNPDFFKINIVDLPEKWVRTYRMTLDYPEDLEMFEKVCTEIGREKKVYTMKEVFGVLDSRPDISSLNDHLTLKYEVDKELINILDRETRIL